MTDGIEADAAADLTARLTAQAPAKRRSLLRKLYDWVMHWADTPYGTPALGILSFAESSVFPIPPDTLLIALSVAKPRRAFAYALLCSVTSVLGGLAGYAIGHFLWVEVGPFFFKYVFSQALFERVDGYYQENAFLAVLTAGFTPVPYKVFTVSAGVFQIPLAVFVAASVVGRSARFFLVATVIWYFGPSVRARLEANFDKFALAFMGLFVAGLVALKVAL